jgi:hypothetical protein
MPAATERGFVAALPKGGSARMKPATERIAGARVSLHDGAAMRPAMHMSTAQEAILERIGRTLVDVNEDMAIEPLPEPIVTLLGRRNTRQLESTNIICTLVEALTHPERYRFIERNGELFLQPIQPD